MLALTQNYRSRPEVLEVINHLFAADFGESFQPLVAAGRFADPRLRAGGRVARDRQGELRRDRRPLAQGRGRAHRAARPRAGRLGDAVPGEIVASSPPVPTRGLYEEELRALGLPTFRATGRDYYHQQQVVDLLAYLRLLHEPLRRRGAPVGCSPFVGVSNDALVLLRRRRRSGRCSPGWRRVPGGAVAARCQALPGVQAALRPARGAGVVALARAALRADRRRARLRPRGAHAVGRPASLREPAQLARLARSYEELRGPDVQGFVRFVAEQDAVGASELEAVAEEEGTDVIRLLTIHSAKGLEFKVVVVADAGRDRARPDADEILCLPDGRVGFRVADPETGKRLTTAEYEAVKDAEQAAEEAERRRLYYVAMTRAIDRLIVSGAVGERGPDERTPIGWVLDRLEVDELGAAEAIAEIERGGARVLMRLDRYAPEPEVVPAAPATLEQLELFEVAENGVAAAEAPEFAPLTEVPAPPLHRVRRLSYSALSLFERCSYRYFAERVIGLRPADAGGSVPGNTGLAATEIGDAVHALLEHVDLRAPAVPDDLEERVRARYAAATGEEVERIRGFVASYCSSQLAARIASLEGATAELPFAFEHDGVLLHGRIDVLARDPGGRAAVVLDYKTNSLAAASLAMPDEEAGAALPAKPTWNEPEEIVAKDYLLQRLVYALACFRAGADEVEVVYHFLERSDAVVDEPLRARGRGGAGDRALGGDREDPGGTNSSTPDEFVCADCPALDLSAPGRDFAAADGPQLRARSRRRVGPKRNRIVPIIERLLDEHPDATIALRFRNDLELLVSVDALGADDGCERQPRHDAAVREVPPARGLPRGVVARSSRPISARRASSARDEGVARDDGDAARGLRRPRARHDGSPDRAAGRRAQDGERRAGHWREARRRRRGHARAPALAASRVLARRRSREDRARPDGSRAARALDELLAPSRLPRPPRVPRAPPRCAPCLPNDLCPASRVEAATVSSHTRA